MAKMTRLATTITARYYPTSDMTDAFFADGRLAGKEKTVPPISRWTRKMADFLWPSSHTPPN